MEKLEATELTNYVLIADALLRLKTLENLLLSKGIFTKEEFSQSMKDVSEIIVRAILEKAHVPGDLDEIIKNLQSTKD